MDTDNASTTLGFDTFAGEYNNINQYLIGSVLPDTNPPNLSINAQVPSIATLDEEADIGPVTGYIYLANYRNNYAAPDLQVFDPTGMNQLFSSEQNGADYFNPAFTGYTGDGGNGLTPGGTATVYSAGTVSPFAMKVSPDEQFVACGLINNSIYIMNLVDGIPNPATLLVIPNYPDDPVADEDLRGISWDAGDNVYTVSSGQGLMRIYSLGLTTTATTHNDYTGTNGTFTLTTPSVTVSVVATTPQASQAGGSFGYPTAQPGVFTLTLGAAQPGPVTINFSLSGTGTNGVNYTTTATNTITFPAGVTTETVTITPTANPVSGPTLTVALSLLSGVSYSAVSPSTATVYIANTGPQELVFTGGTTLYRGNSNDFATFTVARWATRTQTHGPFCRAPSHLAARPSSAPTTRPVRSPSVIPLLPPLAPVQPSRSIRVILRKPSKWVSPCFMPPSRAISASWSAAITAPARRARFSPSPPAQPLCWSWTISTRQKRSYGRIP
jgi:hypothetical protein